MKPHALLLRPKDAAMLAPDVCGGRPPTAMWTGREWLQGPVTIEGANGWPIAVVLAWGGKTLELGLARTGLIDEPMHEVLDGSIPLASLRALLEDVGELVALDEHGRAIE